MNTERVIRNLKFNTQSTKVSKIKTILSKFGDKVLKLYLECRPSCSELIELLKLVPNVEDLTTQLYHFEYDEQVTETAKFNSLKSLSVFSAVSDILKVIEVPSGKLRKFSTEFEFGSDDFLIATCKFLDNQPNLKSLAVNRMYDGYIPENFPKFNDDDFDDILSAMSDLEALEISHLYELTHRGFQHVFKLPKLRQFSHMIADDNCDAEHDRILETFAGKVMPTVERFYLYENDESFEPRFCQVRLI